MFILNTASPWIIPKRFTAPQHTRSFCRRFTPTKSFACTAWAVFFFSGKHRTLIISLAVRTRYRLFSQRCCKTGAGTSFGTTGDPLTSAAPPLLIFCVLTIRKHLSKVDFERSGRGQEPSHGHKFSILENLVFHRDFTSATLVSFDVILLGRACPKPCSWFAPDGANSNGVSCLHNFTEELSNRQEVQ